MFIRCCISILSVLLITISAFSQKAEPKEKDGLTGFKVKRKLVLDYQFDSLVYQKSFGNEYYKVRKEGKWGIVTGHGALIAECVYDTIKSNPYTEYLVMKDSLYGVLDADGNVVLDFQYDYIQYYMYGVKTLVKYQGKWCNLVDGKLHCDLSELTFRNPERMPIFPGCEHQLLDYEELKDCSQFKMVQYLYSRVNYPAFARERGISGTVIVEFIINAEGKVQNPVLIRDIGGGCGEEVLKIVKSMPGWTPGQQNGINVATLYILPMVFKLE